jgi:hypothetical protein
MQQKLKLKLSWLQKVAVGMAFFGFLSTKEVTANGLPPLISVPPVGLSVLKGGTLTLVATIGVSFTKLTVKWYRNGQELKKGTIQNLTVPILGTTISTLTIPNATEADEGAYTIQAQNGGGEVTSLPAIVVILDLPDLVTVTKIITSQCGMTNGGFHLQLLKPATSNCVVEASSDFVHWTPIYTNSTGSTNISCLDTAAMTLRQRYYRSRLQ